jgi:hypothetical protein
MKTLKEWRERRRLERVTRGAMRAQTTRYSTASGVIVVGPRRGRVRGAVEDLVWRAYRAVVTWGMGG